MKTVTLEQVWNRLLKIEQIQQETSEVLKYGKVINERSTRQVY